MEGVAFPPRSDSVTVDTTKAKEAWGEMADWERKNKAALKTMCGEEFGVRLLAHGTGLKTRDGKPTKVLNPAAQTRNISTIRASSP